MFSQEAGKFTVRFGDTNDEAKTFYKEGIFIGRLPTCEIVLDDKTVSRIHAAINYADEKYSVVNLSASNVLTLNGRRLAPQQNDILADGDTIQIGPYVLQAAIENEGISLEIERRTTETFVIEPPSYRRSLSPRRPPRPYLTFFGKNARGKRRNKGRGCGRPRNPVRERQCSTGARPAISGQRGGSACLSGLF
jgi:pSer/pThr/pTyr-binding forkhead associated (FHA) protein